MVVVCQLLSIQGDALCKECFFYAFEEEIHRTIVDAKLFQRGDKIAVGASGGKGRNYIFLLALLLHLVITCETFVVTIW